MHSLIAQVQVLLYFIVPNSVDDIIVFCKKTELSFQLWVNCKSRLGGTRELLLDTVVHRCIFLTWAFVRLLYCFKDFAGNVHLKMRVAVQAHFGYPMPNIALSTQWDLARLYVFQCHKKVTNTWSVQASIIISWLITKEYIFSISSVGFLLLYITRP